MLCTPTINKVGVTKTLIDDDVIEGEGGKEEDGVGVEVECMDLIVLQHDAEEIREGR